MDASARILIVDDEPDARDTLEALLFREGYDLVYAASGPEALALVEELSPDAILLDVMMPGMDGFEVCRRLRANPLCGEVPVILVTALDDRDARIRGIEAGADDFVTKPVDRLELRARLRSITRLNRYRRLLWERSRRQQAEEETLQRNHELILLNGVITAVSSTFDVKEILTQACRALAEALGMPLAMAALLTEDRTRFSSLIHYQEQGVRGQPQRTLCQPTLPPASIPNSPLAVTDVQEDPLLAHAAPQLGVQGIRSMLIVPILARDRIMGSIELSATEPKQFTDSDLTLAQSVATAVGQGMENSQLYREVQLHVQGLEETVAQRTLELQTERDRTQAILEALGEAVIVADTEGRIAYANPAAATLTGFGAEELIGKKWTLRQGDPLAAEFHTRVQEAVKSGEKWSGETVYRRRDGTLYYAAVTVAPLLEPCEGEKPLGFVSVHRDITPIKEAERLKDEFVSNVSHELRTPLSVVTLVSGNLDALYDRLGEEKRRQMIRDVREHIRALNEVIDGVLEISRLDSHSLSMERARVDLASLTREEVQKQLPLAARKAQTVRVLGDEDIPVWGNEGQLRQVIRNLLNNAIKYTPSGGLISCECLPVEDQAALEDLQPAPSKPLSAGRWVALRVMDTGIGISEQDLPYVFERFYRVKAQGNVPGTGLGLAIAKDLVTLHSGHLSVTSAPEQGSTFTVFLPLCEGEVR